MTLIINPIAEGGPVFMILLLIIIGVILVLFILALLGKRGQIKSIQLIGHLSLFGMMWGFLGSTIGLISAFDAIGDVEVAKPIVAGGLKVALLTTVFGLITFLIGRATIIILTLKSPKK